MKKSVFISYSDLDKTRMRATEKMLLKSTFLTPIIIADKRSALTHLSDKVKRGIQECDYFVPILTQNSIFTSCWRKNAAWESGLRSCAINNDTTPAFRQGLLKPTYLTQYYPFQLPRLLSRWQQAPPKGFSQTIYNGTKQTLPHHQ